MVTLELFEYNGHPQNVNKTLTPYMFENTHSNVIQGLFYGKFDVLKPTLIIRSNEYINANYLRIVDLNKYYFVSSIEIDKNKFVINLRIDVLQTYKSEILNTVVTVVNKSTAANYISNRDNIYNLLPIIDKLEFSKPTPFNENGKIIMVALKGKS